MIQSALSQENRVPTETETVTTIDKVQLKIIFLNKQVLMCKNMSPVSIVSN